MTYLLSVFGFISKWWKWILGGLVISALVFLGWKAYEEYTGKVKEIIRLTEENAILETVNAQNEAALEFLQEHDARIRILNEQLNEDMLAAEEYINELERKFSKRDLQRISKKKPTLVERRINDETRNRFRSIECATGGVC